MISSKPDKRQQILNAAVRTFARKGFHETRVSDIAEEAGVAYGLVYHYFTNKDEILTSIFQNSWTVFVEVLKMVEGEPSGLRAQLESIFSFLLETYRDHPEMMQVIVLDLTRSPRFLEKRNLVLFREAFAILERVIVRHQESGAVRTDLDARIACTLILGSMETVLSAYVLGHLELGGPESFEKAKHTFVEMTLSGLTNAR